MIQWVLFSVGLIIFEILVCSKIPNPPKRRGRKRGGHWVNKNKINARWEDE